MIVRKGTIENTVGKGENIGKMHFVVFSTMFLILLKKNSLFTQN